jgi:hypothetical protein
LTGGNGAGVGFFKKFSKPKRNAVRNRRRCGGSNYQQMDWRMRNWSAISQMVDTNLVRYDAAASSGKM